MNDRDPINGPIEGLLEDARATLDRARAAVPPDFAAVLARAKGLTGDDAAIFVADDDERDDPVVDIRMRARVVTHDGGLDALVSDARASVERMVEGRRMRAIPAMPVPRGPQRSAWRRPAVILTGTLGLAAAAILAFSAIRGPQPAELAEPSAPLDQAFRLAAEGTDSGMAIDEGEPVATPPRPAPPVVSPPVTPPPLPAPAEIDPSVVRHASPRAAADRLRDLSDAARARWQAGDRTGAEALFVEVTRNGGRSALAELAWGDLFALADQLGDRGRLAKRWTAYLAKFPRGRYADDARAGLCRGAKDRVGCWRAYLEDFPRGSYRNEAATAMGTAE